jgi:hypothetical protein
MFDLSLIKDVPKCAFYVRQAYCLHPLLLTEWRPDVDMCHTFHQFDFIGKPEKRYTHEESVSLPGKILGKRNCSLSHAFPNTNRHL